MGPLYEDEGQVERDLVVATDDEGNELTLEVVDYFFYNGEEYAIMTIVDEEEDEEGNSPDTDAEDDESAEAEPVDCFVMKVVAGTDENGEEIEEFLPIEDEALESRLLDVASTRLAEDEDPED